MKRLLSILLVWAMVCSMLPVTTFATTVVDSGTCGENLTWTLDDEGTLTISGTGPMTDYEYCSTPWYGYHYDIKTVIIQEGVTTIGDSAFGDIYLESVTIPHSVTTIGDYAFWFSDLESVTIPHSIITIGEGAFGRCYNMSSVTFVGNVPSFGNDTFYDVMAIAFYPSDNASWTDEVKERLGPDLNWAARCTGHTYSDTNSDNICDICGANRIVASGIGGENITWTLDCDGTLMISGYGAMDNSIYGHVGAGGYLPMWYLYRTAILAVEIEEGIESIDGESFKACSNLTRITIPQSVQEIFFGAFRKCKSLTSITIPANVTVVHGAVFEGCTSLKSIRFEGSAPDIWDYLDPPAETPITIYYPADDSSWTDGVKASFGSNLIWVPYTPGDTDGEVSPGDMDGDSVIDDNDVARLLWYTLFSDAYEINGDADFNGDGIIDDADVAYLLWHTLFPDEYPLN